MKFRSSSGQVYSSVALKQCKILFNVMSSGCCHVSTFFPAWALVFGLQLLVHVFSTNCRVIFYWFFPKCLFISLIPWVVNYSCGATWLFTETLKGWGIMQKWMRSKKKKRVLLLIIHIYLYEILRWICFTTSCWLAVGHKQVAQGTGASNAVFSFLFFFL